MPHRFAALLCTLVILPAELLLAAPPEPHSSHDAVLKQRVASRHGHLSNRDAAAGLDELICDRLRAVVLYHLSETNNLPELAYASVAETLENAGCQAKIVLSSQDQTSDWIDLNVC